MLFCLCQALHPSLDVDPIAVNSFALFQHIAEVDPYAKEHLSAFKKFGVALGEFALDLNRAVDRAHRAAELG